MDTGCQGSALVFARKALYPVKIGLSEGLDEPVLAELEEEVFRP